MPYPEEARMLALDHIAAIREKTVCAHCAGQPIEWHNIEHEVKGNRRVSRLAALGFPIHVIDKEIASCVPLCRSCHMKEDGRTTQLQANRPRQKGDSSPPQACKDCGELAKPMRRGLCRRCYDAYRGPR